MRLLTLPWHAASRFCLAIRYWATLDYTWHLAWVKAAR